MKTHIYLSGFCIAFFLITSCSSKLSESKAEKEVIKYFEEGQDKYPIAVTANFPTAVIYKKAPSPRGFGKITLCLGAKYSEFKTTYDKLLEKKLITTSLQQEGCTYMKADLTDAGKEYYIGKEKGGMFKDYSSHIVKTYEFVFDEITGIREIEQFNIAEVEFTLKADNLTPFASVFGISPNQKRKCVATFEKYNDGWRINGIDGWKDQSEF